MRTFLVIAVVESCLAFLGGAGEAEVKGLPNILFLMADQHRYDAMGPGAHTPHLDALADSGAKFLAHYSSTPTCTPARAAILTGRSPWHHGMLGYADAVAPHYPRELPVMMAQAGLQTTVVGKNHFGWNKTAAQGTAHGYEELEIYDGLGSGFDDGSEFDDYDQWFQKQRPGANPLKSGGLNWNDWAGTVYAYDEWLHPTAWTGRHAARAVRDLAATGKPFYLKVSFHRPHSPYDPPKRWLDATPSPKAAPSISIDGWDRKFQDCAMRPKRDTCCGEQEASALDFTRRAYLANVAFVDEQIGLVLDAVKAAGVYNNTMILYTSDHGDMRMDHYLWRKSFPYEGSVHVPLIMWWPPALESLFGGRRGVEVTEVTELRDILPTLLDVLGQWNTSLEGDFDGRPLTPLIRGDAVAWRRWIDLEHNVYCRDDNHWNALTDGASKYIFHAMTAEESLFNLTADPGERVNLAKDRRNEEVVSRWRRRLVEQFQAEGRGSAWVTEDGRLTARSPCNFSPHWDDGSGQRPPACEPAAARVPLSMGHEQLLVSV